MKTVWVDSFMNSEKKIYVLFLLFAFTINQIIIIIKKKKNGWKKKKKEKKVGLKKRLKELCYTFNETFNEFEKVSDWD